MDEYEVRQHFSGNDSWGEIPSPRFFNNDQLDEAKERCNQLNRRDFGSVKGSADDYYGVVRIVDQVCIYPE